MGAYPGIIGRHLAGLVHFRGREARTPFWLYVATVLGLGMVSMFAVMVPQFVGMFGRMQKFAVLHPDQATVRSGPGQYSISIQGYHPELMPDFTAIMGGLAVICTIIVVLLAAAVARRLHDCGRRGFWGLMPLPFLATGMTVMPMLFAQPALILRFFLLMFLNNGGYLASLGLLGYLLAGAGDEGENRFGPRPQT